MPQVAFGYKAIKPIRAEHPVGSGTVVEYEPGEEVPASEWGRAADALVENGKIMRYAMNVYGPGDLGPDTPIVAATSSTESNDPNDPRHGSEGEGYPRSLGNNRWELSDGTEVRGKRKALQMQAALQSAAVE